MEEGVSDYTLAIPTFGFTASTWLHQHSLAGSLVFDCKLNGIFHKAGPGKVVAHSVPGDSVVIKLAADGTRQVCPKASVCGSRKAYEARDLTAG